MGCLPVLGKSVKMIPNLPKSAGRFLLSYVAHVLIRSFAKYMKNLR